MSVVSPHYSSDESHEIIAKKRKLKKKNLSTATKKQDTKKNKDKKKKKNEEKEKTLNNVKKVDNNCKNLFPKNSLKEKKSSIKVKNDCNKKNSYEKKKTEKLKSDKNELSEKKNKTIPSKLFHSFLGSLSSETDSDFNINDFHIPKKNYKEALETVKNYQTLHDLEILSSPNTISCPFSQNLNIELDWFESFHIIINRLHFLKELFEIVRSIKKERLSKESKTNPSTLNLNSASLNSSSALDNEKTDYENSYQSFLKFKPQKDDLESIDNNNLDITNNDENLLQKKKKKFDCNVSESPQ